MYFGKIGNYPYGEINERGISNPHPGQSLDEQWRANDQATQLDRVQKYHNL